MDSKTTFWGIIIILLAIGIFFAGRLSVHQKNITYEILKPIPYTINLPEIKFADSSKKVRTRKIYIPQIVEVDSTEINNLICQRDSLANLLDTKKVKITTIDTLISAEGDSAIVVHNELTQANESVVVRQKPKKIEINEKIIAVPVPENKTWWNNPFITIPAAAIIGYTAGKLTK